MASESFLPPAMWESGTNQNSIPANDNALRFQISQTNVNNGTTAQPVSPVDGAAYIIQSTHTGTQWSTFTPKDVAIYSSGTWYAFAPSEGQRVSISGVSYIYTGGAWTAASSSSDMLSVLTAAEISVTGATTATFGRMHVCSGTTADYTLSLPAVSGNAGKFIGVRMASGLTRWVTLDANGSELIDGALTRKMWANETAILMCDGSAWTKVSGKSIPIRVNMARLTNAFTLVNAIWNGVLMNTVIDDNTSALAVPSGDTSGGRVRVLRPGSYFAAGFCTGQTFTLGATMAAGAVNTTGSSFDPTSTPNSWGAMAGATLLHASGAACFNAAASTYFYVACYNGDSSNRTTPTGGAGSVIQPTLSVVEQTLW